MKSMLDLRMLAIAVLQLSYWLRLAEVCSCVEEAEVVLTLADEVS